MGILWWRKGNKPKDNSQPNPSSSVPKSNAADTTKPLPQAPGMNGAVEVPRPPNVTVSIFEFGSVAASTDKVTLAGYCPVSEDLEPCRWEILPAIQSNAPQFRVVCTASVVVEYTQTAVAKLKAKKEEEICILPSCDLEFLPSHFLTDTHLTESYSTIGGVNKSSLKANML
ncbi:hypothetical protein VNO80_09711 [Phaseolus coccineus]|uniref:Uncharacterized protein n=1 Tax=Phaseolus coccineus TaxID=3886 RepID=A0AAN9NC06_PHACN